MNHCTYKGKTYLLSIIISICLIGFPAKQATVLYPETSSNSDLTAILGNFLSVESQSIPEWRGDLSLEIIPHYDLTGKIVAYVASIENLGHIVGYITVSSAAIPNPILEFSTEPARYKNLPQLETRASNLGYSIDNLKPLYLGMLGYFYPVNIIDKVQLIEMGSLQIITIPDVDRSILEWKDEPIPPKYIKMSITPLDTTLSITRVLLYGPDYWWYRGCGPTAVGNIMGYWADRGYPNLVYGGSQGDYRGTIDQLAILMGTTGDGWTWLPINGDIVAFAGLRGYSFQSVEKSSPSFDELMNEINNHRPTTILVNGHVYYGNHFITMFGYDYDPSNSSYQYMIVHDTWGHGDYWVQYGVGYSHMWKDTVVPPWIYLDTTPPTSSVNPLAEYQINQNFDVVWNGTDIGWGVAGFDIQYRDGPSGVWTDWMINTHSTSALFNGLRGHQYFFRSRAYDLDHNYEQYPGADGDTSTTVATYILRGSVRTNRDEPIYHALVNTNPTSLGTATTNGLGIYNLGIANSGIYSITITSNPSYGVLPPVRNIDVSADTRLLPVYLPPEPSLLQNGDFENGLDQWTASGTVSPSLANTPYTGFNSITLGQNTKLDDGNSLLAQVVNIPEGIDDPVLSLVYQAGSESNTEPLYINLTSTTTSMSYTLLLDSTVWQHVWFDLSMFAGQETTITFEIQHSTLDHPNTVRVDDISIGSPSPGAHVIFLPITVKYR